MPAAAAAGQPQRLVHGRGRRLEKKGRQRSQMGEAGKQADRRRMADEQVGEGSGQEGGEDEQSAVRGDRAD